ncbi:N-acetylglutaminylglutamine amidotransferase [Methylobacterium dankookense]|uniref:asparagine synthase (glutamine-hydrolyzing) n=1 Tax=Methylobacterium dankookense TaxID=560405 RepID=A0A564G493_9HYPH|nr:N-acetylglutaminylglutamine amidotransferase [Methylobacterium dankookense]GJD56513.1 Asparagine synthetase [glutamine-hydrolyzing] 1 [Methylobacterium dankookense]VUF15309.1 Asparagine synthetase [glutamine-hydrolyzing] 1 [Methylobacterium dankookense]
MCGIAGEIRFDGPADAGAVRAMMGCLAPRGPDASGLHQQGRIAFGHRRLKIIDLSEAGQQPMVDSELGLAAVFNGCIYNYPALREELSAKGYRFFSTSDTEVILKAYHAWGRACVHRFLGMFAFAIHERDSGRVVLGRDRLGIKPLYLAEVAGALRFASSLPALLAAGEVDTAIDPAGLHTYMSFHAVVPAPNTILKGVKKLPPATLLTVEPDGTRRQETYWTLEVGPRPEDATLTEADWRARILDMLALAVERRQIADVPTGVLLSGGLDSSLLVALLAHKGQTGLKTFAVGFDAVNGVEGDEFKYSDLVAETFETDHIKIAVDAARTLEALPLAIRAMSEPQMSHDAVAFLLLSQEVSRHVKVVQSGQGADEIFGGYHWYPKMVGSTDPAADYARVYFDRDHAEMRETLAPAWLGPDYSRDFVESFLRGIAAQDPVDKILQLDTQIMLVDDPVKRVDNMTMACGLEARVPFLDHELVELAARVPAALKVKGGGKHILKEAARAVLPAEVIDRPKGYFPVPALKHIRGPYMDFVRDVLDSPAARERGLFSRTYVDHLLADPDGTLTPKGHSKLWQVALLEAWLQAHDI